MARAAVFLDLDRRYPGQGGGTLTSGFVPRGFTAESVPREMMW